MATSRRELLKLSGIATASLLLSQKSIAAWAPSARYPDPSIVALDDSFRDYMVSNSKVEQIATGCRWAEGPVWFGDTRMLLWSDIPNNAVMRWDEATGTTSVFRQPSNNANGHARDRQGRLISCEHDTRRITRTESDGPNRLILAWDIEGNQLKNRRVHIDCGNGTADGIAIDVHGNLWCGWGMGTEELDGVRVFNAQGKAIGMIHLPERCANLCFGGEQRNRLFMASSTSVYSLYVNTQGAKLV